MNWLILAKRIYYSLPHRFKTESLIKSIGQPERSLALTQTIYLLCNTRV